MAAQNSRPKPAGVLIRRDAIGAGAGIGILSLLPAALASAIFHVFLFGMLFLLSSPGEAAPPTEKKDEAVVNADPSEEPKNTDPFLTGDVDESMQEFDTDINYKVERKAEV